MGLDICFYRCKKECYAQLSNDPKSLSAKTRAADERWMQQQRVNCGSFDLANQTPTEDEPVVLVDQWLQHVGAVYRWLTEHTDLRMEEIYPIVISREAIFALNEACKTVARLELDDDGCIDVNVCEQYLPAIDEANCEYYHPARGPDYFGTSWYGEEYQQEAQAVLDTLNLLLKTTDFENEVVLVQASW